MVDAWRTGDRPETRGNGRWPSVHAQWTRHVPPRTRVVVPLLSILYLGVLLLLVLVLRGAPPAVAAALLQASSTDVWHLVHDPVLVLVASALWLPVSRWWVDAALLAVLLPVLERRVGWRQTAAVFLSGHVLATLLTELPVGIAVAVGWSPAGAAHRLDVGVSYGLAAVVGAGLGLLPLRARRVAAVVAVCVVLVPLLTTHDMPAVGHACSLAIGRLWWVPLATRQARPACRPGPVSPRTRALGA